MINAELKRLSLKQNIEVAILRRFGADIIVGSHFIRSKHLSMDEIINELPDDVHGLAEEVVLKMCDDYTLVVDCRQNESTRYYLNPNKHDLARNLSSVNRITFVPPEEIISANYKKVFEKTGARDSNGKDTVYIYYQDKLDKYHFCVLIKNSLHSIPEKRDLGSLQEKNSVIYGIWYIIDNKIEKDVFYKRDLYSYVLDYNKLIGNKQPLKAAIEILIYLGYIRKTGKSSRRSEQYMKTGNKPPVMGLDQFVSEGGMVE